jgi:hypothetical protein
VSHLLNNVLPLNRGDTIFSEGGKSIAIDSEINYRTKLTTVGARVPDVRKMRLDTGKLIEQAGVKNSNVYWRHSRSMDSASCVIGIDLRLKDVFSCV